MEPTLDEAVASLLGNRAQAATGTLGGLEREELERILDDLVEAVESLQGDTQMLEQSLDALRDLTRESN